MRGDSPYKKTKIINKAPPLPASFALELCRGCLYRAMIPTLYSGDPLAGGRQGFKTRAYEVSLYTVKHDQVQGDWQSRLL